MKVHNIMFVTCFDVPVLYQNKTRIKPCVKIPSYMYELLMDPTRRMLLTLDQSVIQGLYQTFTGDFEEFAENLKSLVIDHFLCPHEKTLIIFGYKEVISMAYESITSEEVLPLHSFTGTVYTRSLLEGESYVLTYPGGGWLVLEKLIPVSFSQAVTPQPRLQ